MTNEIIDFVFAKAKEQNISYNQLARLSGVSRFQIQNLLHGRSTSPNIRTATGLLKAVGYTLKIEQL
jgi:transcriptional regulator with XRE-family HTH domain